MEAGWCESDPHGLLNSASAPFDIEVFASAPLEIAGVRPRTLRDRTPRLRTLGLAPIALDPFGLAPRESGFSRSGPLPCAGRCFGFDWGSPSKGFGIEASGPTHRSRAGLRRRALWERGSGIEVPVRDRRFGMLRTGQAMPAPRCLRPRTWLNGTDFCSDVIARSVLMSVPDLKKKTHALCPQLQRAT